MDGWGERGQAVGAGRDLPTGASLVPASDPRMFADLLGLRRVVWQSEPHLADLTRYDPCAAMARDLHDLHGLHWVVLVEGRAVAAARVCVHDRVCDLPFWDAFRHLVGGLAPPIAALNRLVVHPRFRRRGFSRLLTDVRLESARAQGARFAIVEAAPNRVRALRQLGFEEAGLSVGQPWDLVPYRLMVLDLRWTESVVCAGTQ